MEITFSWRHKEAETIAGSWRRTRMTPRNLRLLLLPPPLTHRPQQWPLPLETSSVAYFISAFSWKLESIANGGTRWRLQPLAFSPSGGAALPVGSHLGTRLRVGGRQIRRPDADAELQEGANKRRHFVGNKKSEQRFKKKKKKQPGEKRKFA